MRLFSLSMRALAACLLVSLFAGGTCQVSFRSGGCACCGTAGETDCTSCCATCCTGCSSGGSCFFFVREVEAPRFDVESARALPSSGAPWHPVALVEEIAGPAAPLEWLASEAALFAFTADVRAANPQLFDLSAGAGALEPAAVERGPGGVVVTWSQAGGAPAAQRFHLDPHGRLHTVENALLLH